MTMTKVLAGKIVVKRAGGSRTISVVASTDTPDRSHDVVDQRGWRLDNYRRNPVVLWQHDSKAPIAKASNVRVEQGKLLTEIIFPEQGVSSLSDRAWGLIQAGVLRTVSVGFRPLSYEPRKDDPRGVRYTAQELLEVSVVSLPANTDATTTLPLLGGRSATAPRFEAAQHDLALLCNAPGLSRRHAQLAALRRATAPDRAVRLEHQAAASNRPRLAARAAHLARLGQ